MERAYGKGTYYKTMVKPLVQALANAIAKQEGYFNPVPSRAKRNNNPGNIWDGVIEGKKKRIWPRLPIDDKGFIIFPKPEDGWAELIRQIELKISRKYSLIQLLTDWAPPNENDTNTYIKNVSNWLKINPEAELLPILDTWTGEVK